MILYKNYCTLNIFFLNSKQKSPHQRRTGKYTWLYIIHETVTRAYKKPQIIVQIFKLLPCLSSQSQSASFWGRLSQSQYLTKPENQEDPFVSTCHPSHLSP